MYLEKRPTIFVKNGQLREVFHTVTAAELKAAGWVIQGEDELAESADITDAVADNAQAEQDEAGEEVQDDDEEEVDLSAMTKAELVAFAEDVGVKIDPHSVKAVIIETIREGIDEVERA